MTIKNAFASARHHLLTENERREIRSDLSRVFNKLAHHPFKSAFKGLGIGYLVPDAINTVGLIAISPAVIGLSAVAGLAIGAAIAFTVHESVAHKQKKRAPAFSKTAVPALA